MSREIKFRAWDKNKKEMIPSESIVVPLRSINNLSGYELELMQYTGLHDKNGIEIYEDDIIQLEDRIVRVIWLEELATFDSKFIKYTDVRLYGWDGVQNNYLKNYEIIGNIHENLELLREDNGC